MDGHTPPLCIDSRAQHGGGAEEYAHRTFIHGGYHRLACLVCLALLYEAHLMAGDAVVLHQFAFYLGIDIELRSILLTLGRTNKFALLSLTRRIPAVSRLIGAKV